MKKIAIAAVLAAFVATPATAGTYIGINAGTNKMGYSDVNASTAYSLLGGLSFSENIAAEVAYTSFGSAEMTGSANKVTGNAMSLAAVGSFPMSNAVSLFGKLGVAMTKMEVVEASFSESKSYLTFGLGAQFNVSSSVGFRLGYDSFKVGSTDPQNSNLVSLGVLFHF